MSDPSPEARKAAETIRGYYMLPVGATDGIESLVDVAIARALEAQTEELAQAKHDRDAYHNRVDEINEYALTLKDAIEKKDEELARLRETVKSVCDLFTDSTPENISMVVGAYVRTIQGVKDRLLAENERLERELAAANQRAQTMYDAGKDATRASKIALEARIATLEQQAEETGKDKAKEVEYRMLVNKKDKIQKRDELLRDDAKTWEPVGSLFFGQTYSTAVNVPVRRPIQKEAR